jgi:NDP-sugar pyrophosphorylase family protein
MTEATFKWNGDVITEEEYIKLMADHEESVKAAAIALELKLEFERKQKPEKIKKVRIKK